MTLAQRKYINNNKFDIGKLSRSTLGYESGNVYTPEGSSYTSGINYDSYTNTINKNITALTISTGASYLPSILNNFSNGVQLPSALNSIGKKAADSTVKTATNSTGQTATNAVGSAAGTITGIAGSLYGIANTANAYSNFNNRLNSNLILGSAELTVQNLDGISYKLYNNVNSNSILAYTDALNKSDYWNTTLNAAGTGAQIGGFIGSTVPVVGNLVGTVLGGTVGLLTGGMLADNASEKARQRVEEKIGDVNNAINGYNENELSIARSKMYRQRFYQNADKGKNSHDVKFMNGKPGSIQMVHTKEGVVPGYMLGLAGKGETIYDPETGEASTFNEGKERVDNIPTGVPMTSSDTKDTWDRQVIFGNKVNPLTGNTFAQDAKKPAKVLEDALNEEKMNTLHKKTIERNKLNAQNKLNMLASIQRTSSDNGRYDSGKWSDYLPLTVGTLGQLAQLYASKPNVKPSYYNSYVAPIGQQEALNALYSLKPDYTNQINLIYKAGRTNKYSIMNQGGLSSGQKTAYMLANNLNIADKMNLLREKADNEMLDTRKTALLAKAEAAQKNALAQQQANEAAYERYAKAQSAAYNLNQAWNKSLYDTIGNAAKSWNETNQFNRAADIQEKIANRNDQPGLNTSTPTINAYQPSVTKTSGFYAPMYKNGHLELNLNTTYNPFVPKSPFTMPNVIDYWLNQRLNAYNKQYGS